jgi:hypothetical protein
MVFQERFQDAPRESQAVQGIGLLALMLAVALLITPSMTHQIAYRGEDRRGALRVIFDKAVYSAFGNPCRASAKARAQTRCNRPYEAGGDQRSSPA